MKNKLIIKPILIGSKKGNRRLDGSESVPSGLVPFLENQNSLYWLVTIFSKLGFQDPCYVGGYHIEKVIEMFPFIDIQYIKDIEKKNILEILLELQFQKNTSYIILDIDFILTEKAFEIIINNNKVVFGDKRDAENENGVLFIPKKHLRSFQSDIKKTFKENYNSNLFHFSKRNNYDFVDIKGEIADTKIIAEVSEVIFKGKAGTLENLSGLIKNAKLPKQKSFKVFFWKKEKNKIIKEIISEFKNCLLVVRSSTVSEDQFEYSSAGYFHSELDVPLDYNQINLAIEKVLNSYTKNNRLVDDKDEILIQEQITNLSSSGVLFTRDIENNAPYFVINLESGSGRSDVVTSGKKGEISKFYIRRDADLKHCDKSLTKLINFANELMKLTYNDALDIEFGFDENDNLFLFQVRSIPINLLLNKFDDQDLFEMSDSAKLYFNSKQNKLPNIFGRKTFFSNMSDWNPAEMIGVLPNPMALSIYQYIIGDEVWSNSRSKIGYKNVKYLPLIHSFGGKPYVDLRLSLNSFLPKNLDEKISEKWINYCLKVIEKEKILHDKIEFEVAITCLDFDWFNNQHILKSAGLKKDQIIEFKKCLSVLTSEIINQKNLSIKDNLKLLKKLELKRIEVQKIKSKNPFDTVTKLKILIDMIKKNGSFPFSILARYAFIGMSLLKSMEKNKLISNEELDSILKSIPTVASLFSNDIKRFNDNKISINYLIKKYGHLRPHSYDINSKSYKETKNIFYKMCANKKNSYGKKSEFEAYDIIAKRKVEIQKQMSKIGINVTFDKLIMFIIKSISAREKAKFEFMRSLNDFVNYLSDFAQQTNYSKSDLSFLQVNEILNLSKDSMLIDVKIIFSRLIRYRKKRHSISNLLRFSDIICSENDFDLFEELKGKPNFITSLNVNAEIVLVDGNENDVDLTGKIVAIRAADPGFDWIFGYKISGLITQYGGVASHMAIRAAEFGLPAAIGCGSKIFNFLLEAKFVNLDCKNKKVSEA